MWKLLQRGGVVSGGLGVEYGTAMLRTLLLARILGPSEFGTVVSLNVLYAVVTMGTFVGIDRFLVHAAGGGSRTLLGATHAVNLVRGVLAASLLLVLAVPTAAAFSLQFARGSFLTLAGVALLGGFTHLRIQQVQRQDVFWPDALVTSCASLIGLVAAVAAALVLRDYRAVLWGLYANVGSQVLLSHLLARVPYRLSFNRERLVRAVQFGWPLALNGLALALVVQLDRVIVGAWLGMATLGRYGLLTTLVFTPVAVLFRAATAICQPRLAAAWRTTDSHGFSALFGQVASWMALLGLIAAALIATLGSPLIRIVFGARFGVSDTFVMLLALALVLRVVNRAGHVAGLAVGRTTDMMLSNLAGASGLLLTVLGLAWRPELAMVSVGILVGDAIGTVVIFHRLASCFGRNRRVFAYGVFVKALAVIIALDLWLLWLAPTLAVRACVATTFLVAATALAIRALVVARSVWQAGSETNAPYEEPGEGRTDARADAPTWLLCPRGPVRRPLPHHQPPVT